jgi:hypothetical protein
MDFDGIGIEDEKLLGCHRYLDLLGTLSECHGKLDFRDVPIQKCVNLRDLKFLSGFYTGYVRYLLNVCHRNLDFLGTLYATLSECHGKLDSARPILKSANVTNMGLQSLNLGPML